MRLLMVVVSLMGSVALDKPSVVAGVVTDAATKKPLVDVIVTARPTDGREETVVVTDRDGRYRLPLDPGTIVVKWEKESYEQLEREVNVKADRTVQLDAELVGVGPGDGEVQILDGPTGVHLEATSLTNTPDELEFARFLPFVQPNAAGVRSFESLALMAPQVVRDQFGFGFSGAQSPENRYLVDGLSTNDPLLGTNGLQLPIEFVEQTTITTAGLTAEQRTSTGGLLSVATRSGSDEFHGAVWGNLTPGALTVAPKTIPNDSSMFVTGQRNWNTVDFGVDVGGPIIKDHLWFFVGFAPSFARVQRTQSLRRFLINADGTDFQYNAAGYVQSETLPGTTQHRFDDTRALSTIAKLTWIIKSDHYLELSFITTPTTATTPFAFNDTHTAWNGGGDQVSNTQLASLSYWGAFLQKHLLVDARLGWFHTDSTYQPNDGSRPGSMDRSTAYGAPSISFNRYNADPTQGPLRSPYSINDLTALNGDAAALCEPAGTNSSNVVSVRGTDRILFACPGAVPGSPFVTGGLGRFANNSADRLQGTASATWFVKALGHHVAKAGIDVEYVQSTQVQGFSGGGLLTESGSTFSNQLYGALTGPKALSALPTVTTSPSSWLIGGFMQDTWSILDRVRVNAGLRYDNQQLFSSPGVLALTLNNQLSGRIGVAYDVTQLGLMKIFANFAQYTETVPLQLATAVSGAPTTYTLRRRCQPLVDPTPCTDLTPNAFDSYTPTSSSAATVDPKLRPQTTDELLAGVQYEVISNGVLSATWTRRWMVSVIEDMSTEQGAYFLGNPGYGMGAAFPKAVRDYDAFTASFTKAFAEQWTMQASYTYSSLRGNTSGLFRPETGQLAPNTTSDFDQLAYVANRTGPLDADLSHYLKVFAAKQFILGEHVALSVGLAYLGHSGAPINYLAAAPGYGTDESFVLPRGSGGRLPFVHEVDAKVGVTYRFDRDTAVTVTADVFNLFNLQAVTSVDQSISTAYLLPYQAPAGSNPQQGLCVSGSNLAQCPSDGTLSVKAYDPNTGAIVNANSSQLNSDFKRPTGYQAPITVRVGAKFTF